MYLCSITLDPFLKIFGLTSQLRFIFFTNIDRYFSACQYFFFLPNSAKVRQGKCFYFRVFIRYNNARKVKQVPHIPIYMLDKIQKSNIE